MDIVGLGIDLVPLAQMAAARDKARVAEYFLTEEERALVPVGERVTEHLASRFALKEAVIKAFPERITPFEFRITKEGAKPQIVFMDPLREETYRVHVSMTHSQTSAAAIAVVTRK